MSYVNGDFEGCTFEEASFENCHLVQCTLDKCNVWHSQLKNCNTRGCDLKNSSLDSCQVFDGDFQLASAKSSRIFTSKLERANFTNCELYDTNFFRCSFQSCTFRGCFAGPKRVSFRPTSSNVAHDAGPNVMGARPRIFAPGDFRTTKDNSMRSTLSRTSSVMAVVRTPLNGANVVPLGMKRMMSSVQELTPEPQSQLQKFFCKDRLSIDLDASSSTPETENLIDLDGISSPICYSPSVVTKRQRLSEPSNSQDCRFL